MAIAPTASNQSWFTFAGSRGRGKAKNPEQLDRALQAPIPNLRALPFCQLSLPGL
jgi:hypothetical protein